ncbi:MAG: hypothetical protein ACI87E_003271 [Mariniblastus sp.]|jgi:hypothetical protein
MHKTIQHDFPSRLEALQNPPKLPASMPAGFGEAREDSSAYKRNVDDMSLAKTAINQRNGTNYLSNFQADAIRRASANLHMKST